MEIEKYGMEKYGMGKYDIALIGGDERVVYMRPVLAKAGYKVVSYKNAAVRELEAVWGGREENGIAVPAAGQAGTGKNAGRIEEGDYEAPDGASVKSFEEAVASAKIIVGGIPLIRKGLVFQGPEMEPIGEDAFFACVKPGQKLFGGVLPAAFRQRCLECGVECHDYMEDEALAVFNAVATAEGAILEALLHQKTNIHGSRTLVLGYGRCGRVLADSLAGLKAEVTVCCRNPVARAMAGAMGFKTLSLEALKEEIGEFEYIYNTVPAMLLQGSLLKRISKSSLIIDIASAPGGVDYEAAGELEIQVRFCPGLPGKYAPQTSGEALAGYVAARMDGNHEISS